MPQFRRQLEERANTTIIHCFGIMLWWKGPVPCDTNEAAYGVEPLLRLVVMEAQCGNARLCVR